MQLPSILEYVYKGVTEGLMLAPKPKDIVLLNLVVYQPQMQTISQKAREIENKRSFYLET